MVFRQKINLGLFDFHSPVDGHSGNFRCLSIATKTTMSFWGHLQSSPQGTCLGVEWLVHRARVCLTLLETITQFPKVTVLCLQQLLTSILVPDQAVHLVNQAVGA